MTYLNHVGGEWWKSMARALFLGCRVTCEKITYPFVQAIEGKMEETNPGYIISYSVWVNCIFTNNKKKPPIYLVSDT